MCFYPFVKDLSFLDEVNFLRREMITLRRRSLSENYGTHNKSKS